MWGVKYASATAVYARGTSLTTGLTSEDRETWEKPMDRASSPTARSCAG